MKTTRFLIYSLVDPRDGKTRYIGKTTCGLKRPYKHLQPAVLKRDKTFKGNWLRKLAKLGLSPRVKILQQYNHSKLLNIREKYYIEKYRRLGVNLVNTTNGGDGGALIGDALIRMKNRQKEKWLDPEYRLKQSESHRAYAGTPEGFKQCSNGGKNGWKNATHQRYLEASKKMHTMMQDPKFVQKVVTASHTLSARIKRIKSLTIRFKDPKVRRKHSVCLKKIWSDPELRQEQSILLKKAYSSPRLRRMCSERNKKSWKKRRSHSLYRRYARTSC